MTMTTYELRNRQGVVLDKIQVNVPEATGDYAKDRWAEYQASLAAAEMMGYDDEHRQARDYISLADEPHRQDPTQVEADRRAKVRR